MERLENDPGGDFNPLVCPSVPPTFPPTSVASPTPPNWFTPLATAAFRSTRNIAGESPGGLFLS